MRVEPSCDSLVVTRGGCLRVICTSTPSGHTTWTRLGRSSVPYVTYILSSVDFLSLCLTHTHTLSLSLSLSHTHTHTLSLSLSLSHTHTLPLSLTHTLSFCLTHIHTHTHTLSLSLSLSPLPPSKAAHTCLSHSACVPESGESEMVISDASESDVGTYLCTATLKNITTAITCHVSLGGGQMYHHRNIINTEQHTPFVFYIPENFITLCRLVFDFCTLEKK